MLIELNEKEAEAVLQFVDIGLKQAGMSAMGAANMVIAKINAAKQAASKASEKPQGPQVASG